MARRRIKTKAEEVKEWFKNSVTYEGEPYTMDLEQAAAVADESKNAIVVARAGSGKTRTIVAKVVYLVAKCGVRPEEIMAFVFNANAAAEINARLSKMMVNGKPIIGENVRIANTFHAFSRKIVYGGRNAHEKYGEILAEKKDDFILAIVVRMMKDRRWGKRVRNFISAGEERVIDEVDVVKFARMMSSFVNRAQQKFLGGREILSRYAREYIMTHDVSRREREFIEIGVQCYKRYHWFLLSKDGRGKLDGFQKYGTDFNLLVAWASKMIVGGNGETQRELAKKKYILIDEYQDFSQLFLMSVMAVRKIANNAKLFVVGDDWQAINRFAGSDVEYFRNFEKYFPEDVKRFEISTNYRCNYGVVDVAKIFMQKSMQEKGHFKAKSWRAGKVLLVDPKKFEIFELIRKEKRAKDILILHRNNETHMKEGSLAKVQKKLREEVVTRRIMKKEEFDAKVRIMTMHKSKGLEAEVVIILEADEGVIPKIHPDTILYSVFGETEKVALDDQKRLFYVAMTRARKRLCIIHKTDNQGFIKYLGKGVEWLEG